MSVFFRPADGFVGDVIPFFWDGLWHAFYLKAPLLPKRHGADGTPYAHAVSKDLAHWEEWPLVVEPGAPGSYDDVSCFTGTVLERQGTFHLFYTGYRGENKPQTICHATSRDLRSWEKDIRNPILKADPRWYEPNDWRDPFPFWNEEAGEYWMLMAARDLDGPANRRGSIALATSPDLDQWTVQPPFWSPRLYFTHECPDLFRWGDDWTLVYSTFSERMVTHFRTSKSLKGPWIAPANDTFDGRALYAAKTAGDGTRRFVFGWNPTRDGETDEGKWQWGGHMVIHELKSGRDGGFAVCPVPEVEALFSHSQALYFQSRLGDWKAQNSHYTTQCVDGFAACTLGDLPETCEISCTVRADLGTRSCGLLFRLDQKLENYYQLRWEPGRQRVVMDRWPRPGDDPFIVERPFPASGADLVTIKLFLDGTVVAAYISSGNGSTGDAIALDCRAYNHRSGQFGLFVSEGGAEFSDLAVKTV